MEQSEILLRILLTIVFGAILGLESETREIAHKGKKQAQLEERQRIGGLRTYTVLSLIGGIAGIFYREEVYPIVYITFTSVILLVLAAYIKNIELKKAFGLTTEIAILITFLIGFLTTSALVDLTVTSVILILLTFFLSQKRGFGALVEKINHNEVIDLLKFALTSVVVLPILPNKNYTIGNVIDQFNLESVGINSEKILDINIINPFRMWFVVVLITGINLGGYLLIRTLGNKKGIIATSILGGFISSTSTTIALATKSKDNSKKETSDKTLAGGAVIANAVSFVTAFTLVSALSLDLSKKLYPSLLSMLIIGIATGGFFVFVKGSNKKSYVNIRHEASSFALAPAVKFVLLIVGITLLIQLFQLLEDDRLLLLVTAVSGFTGLDPAVIATSELVQSSKLSIGLGASLILAANFVNFVAKVIYAKFYGSIEFTKYLAAGLLISLIGTLAYFFT